MSCFSFTGDLRVGTGGNGGETALVFASLLLHTPTRSCATIMFPTSTPSELYSRRSVFQGQVTLTNVFDSQEFDVLDVPFDPERGSHKITLTPTIFIDVSDFRRKDSPDYFGLAPGKVSRMM